MSGPTFGSIGTLRAGSASTHNIAVPGTPASGDIIVIYLFIDGSATISSLPSGFAHAANSPRTVNSGLTQAHSLAVIWKRSTGGDSGTYAVGLSASAFVYANAVQYPGAVASGDPWDATSAADGGDVATTTTPAVSVTSLGADRLICHAGTNFDGDGGVWSAPSGYTLRSSGGSGVTNLEISDKALAVAGSSGSLQASNTHSGRCGAWVGALIGTTSSGTGVNAGNDAISVAANAATLAVATSAGNDAVAVAANAATLAVARSAGNDALAVAANGATLTVATSAGNGAVAVAAFNASILVGTMLPTGGDAVAVAANSATLTVARSVGNDAVSVAANSATLAVARSAGNDAVAVAANPATLAVARGAGTGAVAVGAFDAALSYGTRVTTGGTAVAVGAFDVVLQLGAGGLAGNVHGPLPLAAGSVIVHTGTIAGAVT